MKNPIVRAVALAIHGPDFSRPMERKDSGVIKAEDIKNFEDLKTLFLENHKSLKAFIDKANTEITDHGKANATTIESIKSITDTLNTIGTRLDKAEAKFNRQGEALNVRAKTVGEHAIESDEFKALGAAFKGRKTFSTKAIVNATGQNQPLVPQMQLPGVQILPNRNLKIRALIPAGRTSSNLVQYAKELVFTNNAGPQAGNSPTTGGENLAKNESDITFTLANAPVVTLAHFIRASKQVLDDAPMLQSYIDGRLTYGLALEEEDEILNGDGTAGQLDGLMHNATAYNRPATGTSIDILRRAMTQLYISEFAPEFMVLNPIDWEAIELTKDTQGRYIFANPQTTATPTLWGLPVVVTNSMTAGQFLVANGTMAAQIWDREDASITVSTEDADNFTKNMVTILAEERLALTVYRATALIKGVFNT